MYYFGRSSTRICDCDLTHTLWRVFVATFNAKGFIRQPGVKHPCSALAGMRALQPGQVHWF